MRNKKWRNTVNKIQKINTVCEVINKFVTEREGSLDEKGVKDLQAMEKRVRELASAATRSRDEISSARSRRDESFDRLQRILKECRMAIKIVEVRERKKVVVPSVSNGLWQRTRIKELAEKYLQALENADDTSTTNKIESLKAALTDYTLANNDTTLKVYNTRTSREEIRTEAENIDGVLDGYISLIAYRLPREVRSELFNRIMAAVPHRGHKATDGADVTTNNSTHTVTNPQLPAPASQQATA